MIAVVFLFQWTTLRLLSITNPENEHKHTAVISIIFMNDVKEKYINFSCLMGLLSGYSSTVSSTGTLHIL